MIRKGRQDVQQNGIKRNKGRLKDKRIWNKCKQKEYTLRNIKHRNCKGINGQKDIKRVGKRGAPKRSI